jgi:SAM-dependent methyltransferase
MLALPRKKKLAGKMGKKKKPLKFNKHELYEAAVQDPEEEISFFNEKFQDFTDRKPLVLKEDFCGTGLLAAEWVRQSGNHVSWGYDIDPDPLHYGTEHHMSKLNDEEKSRVHLLEKNVLDPNDEQVDLIVAQNFSYSVFKKRKDLVTYLKAAATSLKSDGVFFMDVFGGTEAYEETTETRRVKDYTYYWECKHFNPVNNHCLYAIHFKALGGVKREDVFVYDWRLWSIAELRECLEEAGFARSIVYWEGDDGEGGGNGEFSPTEEGEVCDSWVAYIGASLT